MLIMYLYHLLNGYVYFSARKGKFERFINLCTRDKISLWGMKKRKNKFYAYMYASDYAHIMANANAAHIIVRVEERIGFPFLYNRYKNRVGILIGVIMFFAINIFFAMHVWDIKITASDNINTAAVSAVLKANNFKIGSKWSSANTDALDLAIVEAVPGASYAVVNINGCYATVDVRAVVPMDIDPDGKLPVNIVAKCDGYVKTVEVKNGVASVPDNSAVTKGQILISGSWQMKDGRTWFLHANGICMAETKHQIEAEVYFNQIKNFRTGTVKTRRVANIFGINIPLYLSGVYGPYQKDTSVFQAGMFNKHLPVTVTTAKFYPVSEQKFVITKEQAVAQCKESIAKEQINELGNITILSTTEHVEYFSNKVKVTMLFSSEENIAVEHPILINSIK